jgi:diguanylate cyclase (GGDEF)-like protein/PAS domain S-box-containing protein
VNLPVSTPSAHPIANLDWFLQGYAGPVFCLQGGLVTHKNDNAEVFLQEQGWLTELPKQGSITLRHEGELGERVVQWQILSAPEGMVLVLGRDLTLESNLTLALANSRTRLKDLLGLSAETVWETDRGGRFCLISSDGFLGWATDEVIGKRPHELSFTSSDKLATPFLTQKAVSEAKLWLPDKGGEMHCLSISALPLFDEDGAWTGARGLCRDVTTEQEQAVALAAARLRERLTSHITRIVRDDLSPEREFASAARSLAHALSAEGCAVYRFAEDRWQLVSSFGADVPSSATVLAQATLNRGDALMLSGGGHEWLVCRCQHQRKVNGALAVWRAPEQGAWQAEEAHLIEAVAAQIGLVWAQIGIQESLSDRALKDGLTGLLNQRAFSEEMAERFARAQSSHTAAVLMNIDLDNFKTVNDHLGHQAGDDVLKAVAQVLKDCTRPGDVVGRVGGDEFVLWLDRITADEAVTVGNRIIAGISRIAEALGILPKTLSASIGVAPVEVGDSAASLSKRADATMYQAKHSGKGRVTVAGAVLESDGESR